jgi:cell division protein FtsQ
LITRLLAWGIALTLVALPIVGVLNGWFAATRWPVRKIELRAEYAHVSAEQIRATVETHLGKGFFAVQLQDVRDAVSRLPWVERVEARKQWPDTLSLTVYERQPSRAGRHALISRSGDLFEVPGTDTVEGPAAVVRAGCAPGRGHCIHGDCLRASFPAAASTCRRSISVHAAAGG